MAYDLVNVKSKYTLIKNEDLEEIKRFYLEHKTELNIMEYFFNDSCRAVPTKRGKKPKKFDADQVKEIQKKLAEGMSIRKASFEFQCSTRTIQQIKNNKY